jgi:hypothetical protein
VPADVVLQETGDDGSRRRGPRASLRLQHEQQQQQPDQHSGAGILSGRGRDADQQADSRLLDNKQQRSLKQWQRLTPHAAKKHPAQNNLQPGDADAAWRCASCCSAS